METIAKTIEKAMETIASPWKSNKKPVQTLERAMETIAKSVKIAKDHKKTIEKTMKAIASHRKGSGNILQNQWKSNKIIAKIMGWSWKLLQNHWKSNKTIANHWKNNGNHCATIGKSLKSNFSMGGVHPRGVYPPHRKVTFHWFPNDCAMVCKRLKEQWKPLQKHWKSKKSTVGSLRKQRKPLKTIERGLKTL